MVKRKTLRRWNNALHRDIGYLAVGMTLVYAISGIILNHFKAGDFKHPDYSTRSDVFRVDPPPGEKPDKAYVLAILEKIGEQDAYKSYVKGTGYLQIFIHNGTVYVDLNEGTAQLDKKIQRTILKEFNLLHYNNIKKWFTWFSDVYAVALIILSITGLFVLRGRNGILGRGAWLTAIGIIIPAIIMIIYA